MKRIFCLFFISVLLTGCVADQKGRQNAPVTGPVIGLPPGTVPISIPSASPADVDGVRRDIRSEIIASTNTMQNQVSGVNVAVSKLAERFTGIEAHISNTLEATANINTAIHTQFESLFKVQTELAIRNEMTAKLEARVQSDIQLIKDLNLKIGELDTKIQTSANAQVGWNNKFESRIEDVKNTTAAGRDATNSYLPREAVELVIGVIMLICGLFSTALYLLFKASRERAILTAKQEREERQMMNELLTQALTQLPPEARRPILARMTPPPMSAS